MRALLSVILCLSMAVCIMADFELGERQEGDYIVSNRTIFKPSIPWKPMKAVISVKAPPNETITYVRVSNIGDKEANFILISGDIGTASVTVMAIGKLGEGMLVRVEGAAIDPNTITSPAPTTTSIPVETTTEKIVDTTFIPNEE